MDPTTEPTAGTRPGEVTLAVRLIWISITIGLVISGIRVAPLVSGVSLVSVLLFALVFFGIYLFLVSKIAAGRNWARIVFLVLLVIGLPFAVPTYLAELRTSVVFGSISILIAVLQVVATYLLFTRNSNRWFKTRQ